MRKGEAHSLRRRQEHSHVDVVILESEEGVGPEVGVDKVACEEDAVALKLKCRLLLADLLRSLAGPD